MRNLFTLVSFILLTAQAFAQGSSFTYVHDGINRSYILYTPDNLPPQAPLVMLLHGYTSTAAAVQAAYGMNAIADANGFAVCYPQGTQDASGTNFWNIFFPNETVDDIGFLSNLAQDLTATNGFDPSCTYVCGMSNGGMMSYLLGCERPDVFRAFASVTGTVTSNFASNCLPNITVPFMQIHGTSDLVVPYNGGTVAAATFGEFLPVENIFRLWRKKNNCNNVGFTSVPNSPALDFSTVEYATVMGCNNGLQGRFYKVTGGGHTWPGSPSGGFFDFLNPTNQDINASAEIWNFFGGICAGTAPTSTLATSPFDFKSYPNPATDVIQVMMYGVERAQLRIYGMDGRLVAQEQLFEGSRQLAVGQLASGIYLMEIQADDHRKIEKLVIR